MWLKSQDYTHVCVLSDLMSMIQKVREGSVCRQWLEPLRRSKVRSITFIFVPGHSGAGGNERADELAGLAIIDDVQPVDHADIVNAFSGLGRMVDKMT